MKILTCVGTRPNLIKITRLDECFAAYPNINHRLLHTGQHFDRQMNDIFFEELNIRQPDIFLGIQGLSPIKTIAEIMSRMEDVLIAEQPDWVMVPGDVNSSMACGLVASRMGIPVAHIESGLRSFDKTMPEEVNRIMIDDFSDRFFITEQSGLDHLEKEGKPSAQMHFVGNTMIDTLVKFMPQIDNAPTLKDNGLHEKKYLLFTFHRPSNVDYIDNLSTIVQLIVKLSKRYKVVFPIHPRTSNNLKKFGLDTLLDSPDIVMTNPMGYFDFLKLVKNAGVVITDSGGVQEETTFLGVPCLTLRANTERPSTVTIGTNTLLDLDINVVMQYIDDIDEHRYKTGAIPPLWDGHASERLCASFS